MPRHGYPEGESKDAASWRCPLTMCLLACLFDAEACFSRSAAPLRSALAHLGHHVDALDCLPVGGGPHPQALAACLEYILPELSIRSSAAFEDVSQAIVILQSEAPGYMYRRHGASTSRH